MIVFDLICIEQHRFEGWFASRDDFASQQGRGLLECPVCGEAHVEKLPAAKIRKQSDPAQLPARATGGEATKSQQVDVLRIIDYVLTHSEDVGKNFPDQARKIFYEESPQRSIRGLASPSEAQELRDEGIQVFSLPIPPQDRWN